MAVVVVMDNVDGWYVVEAAASAVDYNMFAAKANFIKP